MDLDGEADENFPPEEERNFKIIAGRHKNYRIFSKDYFYYVRNRVSKKKTI